MPFPLTRELGRYVAAARYSQLPAAALPSIRVAFVDTICVAIAGAHEAAPRALVAMLSPTGNESTLLGCTGRSGALEAARINGTSAHALDFDDIAERGGHVSAVLVPAILAEAEALGATGEQMALAYAVGFETIAEIVRRDADQHHDKGWHPTPVFGAIGAAAACASLRGLDAEQAMMAIAISASHSSGIMSNVGTMTKPLHAGLGAYAGVASARLAALGFTGAPDALEHRAGFLAAVSPAGKIDVESPMLAGTAWQICDGNRLSVKKYPLCFFAHRAVDGLLDLLQATPVAADDVERVTVSIGAPNASVLRYHLPQTGLEAKFSMEFAVACGIIAGRLGLAQFTDAFVQRDDVQRLMKRVVVEGDPREDPEKPGYAVFDRVTIQTTDDIRVDSGPITRLRGSADVPLRRDELRQKFDGCLQVGGPGLRGDLLFDAVMHLETLPSARTLGALLGCVADSRSPKLRSQATATAPD